MRLDGALISPELEWLTTRAEKLAFLAARRAPAAESPPGDNLQDRPDQCPGTFPIGIDANGRTVLLYVATLPWADDFRSFLVGHVGLLSLAPEWTLRVVFPPSLRRAVPDYDRAVHEELESRLDPQSLNDLRWYFFHCRRRTDWTDYTGPGGDVVKARFARCAKAFAGPRFTRLYRRWLVEDDAVLTPVPTSVSEVFASGRAPLDLRLLPHTYDHLSPLVSRRRPRPQRVIADAEEGEGPARGLNPCA